MQSETTSAPTLLRVEGLSKRFGDVAAVDRVSIDVRDGEFLVLLGPSGCGKSTLIRLIAGFERPDAGRILLDGVDLVAVSPHRRPVNTMFPSPALFPHLDVEGNVGFGLKQEGLPKLEIAQRTADMLALLRLESLGRRKPHQLTADQGRRVALARCLVKRPRVLLLDEPFAALDEKLRDALRSELTALQRRLGLAFVMVTRDRSDAMMLADRIAVFNRGRLLQVGSPADIYERPVSRWVADFTGDVNVFSGRPAGDGASVEGTAAGRLRVAAKVDAEPGAEVWVAVRPEKMRIVHDGPPSEFENSVAGTVVDAGYLGELSVYTLRIADGVTVKATIANTGRRAERAIGRDDRVWLCFAPDAAIVLTR